MSGQTHTASRGGALGEDRGLILFFEKPGIRKAQAIADGMARNGERAIITKRDHVTWDVHYVPLPEAWRVKISVHLVNEDYAEFILTARGVKVTSAATAEVAGQRPHDAALRIAEHLHSTLTWKE